MKNDLNKKISSGNTNGVLTDDGKGKTMSNKYVFGVILVSCEDIADIPRNSDGTTEVSHDLMSTIYMMPYLSHMIRLIDQYYLVTKYPQH